MEKLVANFSGTTRREVLFGREHLVAPATLIVPGVLNGSRGPLLYPPEEVRESVKSWDHMPLLVYHPTEGSGREPSVINRQSVGYVFGSRFEGDKLISDLWFDVERTKKVDSRVLDALQNNQQIELSTGLGTQNEEADPGATFNSPTGQIPYTHIAHNYKPDHVAILPDLQGACSLEDGCGVLNKGVDYAKIHSEIVSLTKMFRNAKNESSHSEIHQALAIALEDRFGKNNSIWVSEVFANKVIYSNSDQLFKLGYTIANDNVKLSSSEPKKVQRVTKFVSMNTKGGATMALTETQKSKIIDELVGNSCCWEEEDRKELQAMTDNQLTKTKEMSDKEKEAEEVRNTVQQDFDSDKKLWETEKAELVKNQKADDTKNKDGKKTKPMTDDEWMAQAPESVRNTLAHAQESEQREKKALIEQITTNVEDSAKPEKVAFLAKKDVKELREIASFMPVGQREPAQNYYYGQPPEQTPVENIDKEDCLTPPEIDFTENSVFAEAK